MANGYGYTFEEFGPEVAMPGQAVYSAAEGRVYQAAGAEAFEQMPLSAAITMGASEEGRGLAGIPVQQAGFPLLPVAAGIPAAAGALGLSLPGWLLTALGIAGAGYGAYQALGGGEGEGLFGLNILGGDETYRGGIPFGGPGLAEPPAQYVLKEWHVNYNWGTLQYYLVQMPGSKTRKIALYNTRTKKWKVWTWRQPHLAVIGKNMPSHKQLTRLKRNLSRHAADATTILKITRPTAYAKQMGYRKHKRR